MAAARSKRVLPGFGLSLGFTLAYLSLIVLIPLSAVFIKSAGMGTEDFLNAVTSPRVVASYLGTDERAIQRSGSSAAAGTPSLVLAPDRAESSEHPSTTSPTRSF